MTTIERDPALEALFSQVFAGGEILRRELRLSEKEQEYLRVRYPHARVTPLPSPGAAKRWYTVSLENAAL